MRVLLTSDYDWANMGFILSQCLITAGVDAKAVCIREHPKATLPPGRSELLTTSEQALDLINWADVMVAMHSEPLNVKGKPTFVFHGGSRYREDYKGVNDFWNDIALASFIQTNDLFGLGAKNEEELPAPADVDLLMPVGVRRTHAKPLFGHYPTNALTKGSQAINYAFYKASREADVDYDYSENKMSWENHMARLGKRDILIESMSPIGSGWGVTGIEAAAMGKIIIGRFTRPREYEAEYGCLPEMIVVNGTEALKMAILDLNDLSLEEMEAKQGLVRQWVVENHSYEATGSRMKKIMEKYL